MSVRMIPEQIVASTILRMTAEELREHLEEELENNPALEISDVGVGEVIPDVETVPDWREVSRPWTARATDDDEDYLVEVPAEETLRDYLWGQFRAVSAPADHLIGRYLIDSIDDNGYLSPPLLEVAEELGESLERVEGVLRLIQELDPPGVGARDLRECLLLQLHGDHWAGCPEAAIAHDILQHGWDRLTRQEFDALARQLSRTAEEIQAGYAFIRQRLVPYPGQAVRRPWQVPASSGRLIPDVCIRRTTDGYQVDVTDAGLAASSLCVNREYQQVCRAMQRSGSDYSEAERNHVRQALDRARFLLKGLARRAAPCSALPSIILEQPGSSPETRPPCALSPAARWLLAWASAVYRLRATIGSACSSPAAPSFPSRRSSTWPAPSSGASGDAEGGRSWRAPEGPGDRRAPQAQDRHRRRTVSKYARNSGIAGMPSAAARASRRSPWGNTLSSWCRSSP